MSYIELINQFWQTRRSKRITSLQADVYFYLLNECNLRGWENPFEVSNKLICASIGITEPSLIDARNRLQQLDLIEFQSGKKNVHSPVYYLKGYLNNLSRNRVTPLVTSLVTPLVETELKGEQEIDIDIDKDKNRSISPIIPQGGAIPEQTDISENVQKIADNAKKMTKNVKKVPESAKNELSENISEVIETYNRLCPTMPRALGITTQRQSAINARLKQYSLTEVLKAIEMASKSDFLTGQNAKGWIASLDWLLKPTNFTKVIEGHYTNRTRNGINSKPIGQVKLEEYFEDY